MQGPKKSKSYTAFVGEGDSHEMEKLNKKYGSTDEGTGEDVPRKTDVAKVEDETQNLSATNPFAKPKVPSFHLSITNHNRLPTTVLLCDYFASFVMI